MTGTWKPGKKFTLPSGATVRPQSWRRYIVVSSEGVILYRTDDVRKATHRVRYTTAIVLDQAEGCVFVMGTMSGVGIVSL